MRYCTGFLAHILTPMCTTCYISSCPVALQLILFFMKELYFIIMKEFDESPLQLLRLVARLAITEGYPVHLACAGTALRKERHFDTLKDGRLCQPSSMANILEIFVFCSPVLSGILRCTPFF